MNPFCTKIRTGKAIHEYPSLRRGRLIRNRKDLEAFLIAQGRVVDLLPVVFEGWKHIGQWGSDALALVCGVTKKGLASYLVWL
jgi:hypothetical protein